MSRMQTLLLVGTVVVAGSLAGCATPTSAGLAGIGQMLGLSQPSDGDGETADDNVASQAEPAQGDGDGETNDDGVNAQHGHQTGGSRGG